MVGKSDTDERFARNVRGIRAARELSQAEVARRMAERGWSWHQQTVAKVESGDRPVQLGEAEALAEVLDVELWELTRPDRDAELTHKLLTRNIAVVKASSALTDAVVRLLSARKDLGDELGMLRHPSRQLTSIPAPQVESAVRTLEEHTDEAAFDNGRALFGVEEDYELAKLRIILKDRLIVYTGPHREDGGDGEHSEAP